MFASGEDVPWGEEVLRVLTAVKILGEIAQFSPTGSHMAVAQSRGYTAPTHTPSPT